VRSSLRKKSVLLGAEWLKYH
jgi:hypothetical protein